MNSSLAMHDFCLAVVVGAMRMAGGQCCNRHQSMFRELANVWLSTSEALDKKSSIDHSAWFHLDSLIFLENVARCRSIQPLKAQPAKQRVQ